MAEIAALLGDPARASILFALKEDLEISAGDLSVIAGVSPSTTSEHLSKLVIAGLITLRADGRRRYYRLALPAVADVLDGVEALSIKLNPPQQRTQGWNEAKIHARPCIDHLAGRLGTELAQATMAKGYITVTPSGPALTQSGETWMNGTFGIQIPRLREAPRRLLGFCHDWVEEAPHLGGAIAAALLRGMIAEDWLRRAPKSQIVKITPKGRDNLRRQLGIDLRKSPA